MKKFLSLALALVMTLSLVTISAGATEYKDFTDRDEIQYEEAVAVLNRLGIITGYSEGDFRPEGELTRGAAAKIIVSLLIGPEAAEALPTTGNPYPDVPAGNVFAGVISFCKTEGIISGYGDGTFRPTGTLTGFAFAKMLLGALGFDNKIEGFEGAGWTMNVANLGQKAGLFDRISFKGGDTVNRETACQLALNTLKATMVEYGGNGVTQITVNGVPVEIGNGQKWSYVTSNQDFARNIGRNQRDYNQADWYTVEFGEEHFVDLRLEHDKKDPTEDEFGRPSVEWSYKRVTIGTFPLEADYSYNTQVAHNVPETSDASKVRALNLGSYVVSKTVGGTTRNTTLWLNGVAQNRGSLAKVADIADYTDNGAEVYVYISYEDGFADLISDVVVIQSQLMQVKRVGSDAVSLEMYDNSHPDDNMDKAVDGKGISGYNKKAIDVDVADVEVNDDYFTTLSGMKSGDLVVVKPYSEDGVGKYDVGELYIPETVTGALTNVTNHGTSSQNRKAIAVTVGGTKYNIAQWNKKLAAIDGDTLKITRGDVTLTLDEFGNAMLGKNIGETSDWMVVGNFRQSLVDGRLVTIVNGWDISGDPVELNIGPSDNGNERNGARPGDLVYYTSDTSNSVTDWNISLNPADGVYDVYTGKDLDNTSDYAIKTSNSRVAMYGYTWDNNSRDVDAADDNYGATNSWTTRTYSTYGVGTMDSSVKFIFVNFNDAGEVSSIDVRTGARNVTNAELRNLVNSGRWAQACVDRNDTKTVNTVKAVVVKQESSEGDASTLGYISKYIGQATLTSSISSTQNDAANTMTSVQYDNRVVYTYTATLRNASGLEGDSITIYSYDKLDAGDFFYYTKRDVEGYDNFYDIRKPANIVGRATSVVHAELWDIYNADKGLVQVGNYTWPNGSKMYPAIATYRRGTGLGTGDDYNLLNLTRAVWTDLTGNRIDSMSDLKDYLADEATASGSPKYNHYLNLRMVLNDNPDSDGFRDVYMIVIFDERAPSAGKNVAPVIYEDYIATPNGTTSSGATTPPVYGTEKYDFTVTDDDKVMTDITINGTAATVEDLNKTLTAGTVIKFKVPEGYTVTGATLGEDGFYTATVGKDATSITITKGSAPVETGNVTVKMDASLGTVTTSVETFKLSADVKVNIAAPDWAKLGAATIAASDVGDIEYTVYVNDTAVGKGSMTRAQLGVDAATNTLEVTGGIKINRINDTITTGNTAPVIGLQNSTTDLTTDKVEIVITAVKWTTAKVDYVLDGKTIGEGTLVTDASTGAKIDFDFGDAYQATPFTFEVDGAKLVAGGTDDQTVTYNQAGTAKSDDEWYAEGGKKVTVTLSGLTDNADRTLKFTTTLADSDDNKLLGDTAALELGKFGDKIGGTTKVALKVTSDNGGTFGSGEYTGINKNAKVTLKLVLDWVDNTDIDTFDFEITLSNGKTITVTGVRDEDGETAIDDPNAVFLMQEDVSVTGFKVTATKKATVKSFDVDRDSTIITILFDGKIKPATATIDAVLINDSPASTPGPVKSVAATADNDGIEIVLDSAQYGGLSNNQTLKISDGAIKTASGGTIDTSSVIFYFDEANDAWTKTENPAVPTPQDFYIGDDWTITQGTNASSLSLSLTGVKSNGSTVTVDSDGHYAITADQDFELTFTLSAALESVQGATATQAQLTTAAASGTHKATVKSIKVGDESATSSFPVAFGSNTTALTSPGSAVEIIAQNKTIVVTFTAPAAVEGTAPFELFLPTITLNNAIHTA